MTILNFDVIIVGAGPAGASCAYELRNTSLKIAVIEKGIFPRDKICGDALSPDIVNQLNWMNPELLKNFSNFAEKLPCYGVRVYGPSNRQVEFQFDAKSGLESPGFIAKRIDFDNFLFENIKSLPNVEIFQGVSVTDIIKTDDEVTVLSSNTTFKGKIVLGADGAHSIVNKKLGSISVEKNHYCAGLRQYYKGVEGFHPNNLIELHFYKDSLPGYFWVFPLPNGHANVGIGMISSAISKKRVNLKTLMMDLINNHPNLKDRFKNAEPLENIQGYGLPIGSKKRPISGDRFLLLGDAASLIDPVSGEGIGNAIRSGRYAAKHLIEAFKVARFDAAYNIKYDKQLYKIMWPELRASYFFQRMLKYPIFINFLLKKSQNESVIKTLMGAFMGDATYKKKAKNPFYYLKLLYSSK